MTDYGSKRVTKQEIIDQLMKNNVEMQKKTADLLVSVNNLTKKMDELVEIFKKAAEHIEKGEIKEPLARKLAELLEQNKKIARGLLLLERFVRNKEGMPTKFEEKEDIEGLF